MFLGAGAGIMAVLAILFLDAIIQGTIVTLLSRHGGLLGGIGFLSIALLVFGLVMWRDE